MIRPVYSESEIHFHFQQIRGNVIEAIKAVITQKRFKIFALALALYLETSPAIQAAERPYLAETSHRFLLRFGISHEITGFGNVMKRMF